MWQNTWTTRSLARSLAPGIQVKPKAPGADPQSQEAKPKSKQQDGDDRADRVRRSTPDHSLSADDSEYDTHGHVTKCRRASNSPPPTRSDRDMWNAQFYPPTPSYYHPAFFPQPGQYHIIHMVSHRGRHCFRRGPEAVCRSGRTGLVSSTASTQPGWIGIFCIQPIICRDHG